MSQKSPSPELDDEGRARLADLADALIPGGQGLPSARAAEVQGEWIDRVLAAAPGLADIVAGVIHSDEPAEPGLTRLRERDHALFDRFCFAVSAAYFMNPRVRRELGYPGTAPRPLPAAEGEAEYYLEDDVLGPVLTRGPLVRPVPADTVPPSDSTASAVPSEH
jgi:hypothetical protein